MAAVNGLSGSAPLAPTIAAALTDIPMPQRETMDFRATSWNRGCQVLDRLLFTTAYAYTTTVNNGDIITSETIGNGETQTVYGGTVNLTTISNGGSQDINGGTVNLTTISSGGTQNVFGGTVSATTIENGGSLAMWSVSTVSSTTVKSGGILDIYGIGGGSAVGTILSEGYVLRADTNNTFDGIVYSNSTSTGNVTIAGGIATSVTVNSGGLLEVVSSGHQAVATTVNAGGAMNMYDGAATLTTIRGGTMTLLGGTANTTTVDSGGSMTVTTAEIYDSNGQLVGITSGTATLTTVNSGGLQTMSGGTATLTTVNSGGNQIVSGGTVTGTMINGGRQTVLGGAVTATTVGSGGAQLVYDAAASTTVNSGGLQYVYSGGTASDTTVSTGGLMNIEAGAQITGITTLNAGTAALIGNSGSYTIASLAANGGTVKLAYSNTVGRNLAINNLSGSANFVINTDLAAGESDQVNINGTTSSTANTLQVAYDPAYLTGQNAAGSATFATVSDDNTSFSAAATEYGAYRYTPTIISTTSGTTTTWTVTQLTVVAGVSETVHTASDVIAGNLVGWRTENNNLTKRMGELRAASGETGTWLRTYRGEQEISGAGGRTTKQQYNAIQGGYDRKINRDDGVVFTGYALGYLEGTDTYSRGSGDASSISAGAYRSWLGNKGQFLDVIVKVGKLKNSYTSYLNDGVNTKVNGNYENWGTSLSGEYGFRRQIKHNWYIEPQAEVSYSRIDDTSYTASDGTRINNDAVNSLVGRLGLAIGCDAGSARYYGKISLAREFSASPVVTAATSAASPVTLSQDLKENWLEFALGLTGTLDKQVDGYLEITRTNGAKARTPWQVNVGARWNF